MEREALTVVENGGPSLKSSSRGMCPPSIILWDSDASLAYWIMRHQASKNLENTEEFISELNHCLELGLR